MYANAYIICVRYVVASVYPLPSYYRSTCPPRPLPSFSTPTMPDGHWTSVRAYICSSALIYRICIAVNPQPPSFSTFSRFVFSLSTFFFPISFLFFFFPRLIYSVIYWKLSEGRKINYELVGSNRYVCCSSLKKRLRKDCLFFKRLKLKEDTRRRERRLLFKSDSIRRFYFVLPSFFFYVSYRVALMNCFTLVVLRGFWWYSRWEKK